ncbi:MAG: hypothetical protein IVW57_03875 [Ktedonobacterales bacterium]|nr:hypothetical protein [Ktedonobacterales bacterium]
MRVQQNADRRPDEAQLVIAAGGALLVGVLYYALPEGLSLGPRWLLLVLVLVLLLPPLVVVVGMRTVLPFRVARGLALVLMGVLAAAQVGSLALLVTHLPRFTRGGQLLGPAGVLWGINVLVFAVWYWEIDGGGPVKRQLKQHEAADFLFPQQLRDNKTHWAPGFVDYLHLAFCFATALSPADVVPLTHRAKLLMMAEALISLLIVVLLVARSVNILS